jgi:hypothetical protein
VLRCWSGRRTITNAIGRTTVKTACQQGVPAGHSVTLT